MPVLPSKASLTFNRWEQTGLISQRWFKRQYTGCRWSAWIVSIFGPCQLSAPGGWVGWICILEGGFNLWVHPLSLPISLRMKPRGETNLSSEERAELLLHARSELRNPIRNDIHEAEKHGLVRSLGRAKHVALETLLTAIKMTVLPADNGRSVVKSKEICDQSYPDVGSGWRSPEGEELTTLFWPQTGAGRHILTDIFFSE